METHMLADGAIIGLLITVFWVWMLVDCLFNRRLSGASKVCWALFIIFTQIVGAMIYFFIKCTNHNPFEAVASYYKTIVQWSQPTASSHTSVLYYTPTPPVPPKPIRREYQEGYSAYQYQPPQQSAIIPLNQVPDTNAQQSHDEQYEQPMISYPEMP